MGAESDSLTAAFLGAALVTVGLVEMFLKKQRIKEVDFVVSTPANGGKTNPSVTHL